MLRLVVFDMDGTLVQTERLKARSYAQAAVELDPSIDPETVEVAYGRLVGHTREEITQTLLEQFGLDAPSRARLAEFDADEPWQAYVGLRLRYYRAMLDDTALLRAHAWPYAMALLRHARTFFCEVALATTSRRDATDCVLGAFGLAESFDTIVTGDDVTRMKPDPEVYRLVTERLGIAPEAGIAIEDSPSGIRSALAAGLACIAVPTGYTHDGIQHLVEEGALDHAHVVWEPAQLPAVVRRVLDAAR